MREISINADQKQVCYMYYTIIAELTVLTVMNGFSMCNTTMLSHGRDIEPT